MELMLVRDMCGCVARTEGVSRRQSEATESIQVKARSRHNDAHTAQLARTRVLPMRRDFELGGALGTSGTKTGHRSSRLCGLKRSLRQFQSWIANRPMNAQPAREAGRQHDGHARVDSTRETRALKQVWAVWQCNRPTRPEVFSMRCFAEIPRTESPPKEESSRFVFTRALR
jgi:hypothetical protein